jgi:hypothetical protein
MKNNNKKKICGISLTSNMDPNLKSFNEYFTWYESYIPSCVESVESIHIHLSEYKINSFKIEKFGLRHYFIYREDFSIFCKILEIEGIKNTDVYLYLSAWPGRNHPVLDSWLNDFKRIVLFGDLHHLPNPLAYAQDFLRKYKPDRVYFWSSIQNADFICASHNTTYSLANYQLKSTPPIRSLSNEFTITRFGAAHSRFHPRRTYTNIINQSDSIKNIPSQSMRAWFDSIKSDQIYLHTTLAGNFSHHILFPLKKGALLLVDASAAQNFYLKAFLIPDKTCISYLPGQSLDEIVGQYDVNDLNEIAANGQRQINHYFPDFPTFSIYENENSIEYYNYQLLINSRAENLRQVVSIFTEKEFLTLINLIEILQEIHRFLVKKIPIFIIGSPLYKAAIEKITDGYNYFEIKNELNNSEDVIAIYFDVKPNEKSLLAVLVNSLDKSNRVQSEIFDFGEHVDKFKGYVAWIPEFKTWPQTISTNISII